MTTEPNDDMLPAIVQQNAGQAQILGGIFAPAVFEHAQRVAMSFCAATAVPEIFRGRENIGNVLIALDLANSYNMRPFVVMQNMYTIHGKPGIESKLLIAILNRSSEIKGRLKFKHSGEGMKRQCVCSAVLAEDGDVVEATCSMQMAKDAGWLEKRDSMWQKMPDQMLIYRSASLLAKTYFPDLLFGLTPVDEIRDTIDAEVVSVSPADAQAAAQFALPTSSPALKAAAHIQAAAEKAEPITAEAPAPAAKVADDIPMGDAPAEEPKAVDVLEDDYSGRGRRSAASRDYVQFIEASEHLYELTMDKDDGPVAVATKACAECNVPRFIDLNQLVRTKIIDDLNARIAEKQAERDNANEVALEDEPPSEDHEPVDEDAAFEAEMNAKQKYAHSIHRMIVGLEGGPHHKDAIAFAADRKKKALEANDCDEPMQLPLAVMKGIHAEIQRYIAGLK